MKYPRLERKEKLCAKLSLGDVFRCRDLHRSGISIKDISIMFNVHYTTMWKVVGKTPEELKEFYRKKAIESRQHNKEYYEGTKKDGLSSTRKSNIRKASLYPEELRIYTNEIAKKAYHLKVNNEAQAKRV